MILQSLCEYYERKKKLGEIAPDGFIEKRIDFLIELDESGSFLGLSDLREPVKKGLQGKSYYVPAIGSQASKHSNSGADANLLWDKSAFVLGANSKKGKEFESFKNTICRYYANPPFDIAAVLKFLDEGYPFTGLLRDEKAGEALSTGTPVISFRIRGSVEPVFVAPHVEIAMADFADEAAVKDICMVSGEYGIIDPTHPVIKGTGGQPSGCSLIGFNAPSYCSYGKKQSYNSPISKRVSSSYTKALQSLIDSENKAVIADITLLSWMQVAEIEEADEVYAGYIPAIKDPPKDDPSRGVTEIKTLIDSVETGKYRKKYLGNFYVLGLAPNSARLAVKYWETGPVYIFAERLARHFKDFEIIRHPDAREYLTLGQILRATVFESKMANVPSNLAGEVIRSILTGNTYPRTLFLHTLRRIRSESKVTRARAAIIKAYINRVKRLSQKEEELTVALDKNNISVGYRLGRLFAVLEKIQNDALPELNANICDRYYGSASTTPVAVFPRLLKLKNHHVAKLSPQHRVSGERLIGEIMGEILQFPNILDANQQGLFAVGYYHQKQDLYTKKDSTEETVEENSIDD